MTLSSEILALDQNAFSAAFRKSLMKRVKMAGLQRTAAVVLGNLGLMARAEKLSDSLEE